MSAGTPSGCEAVMWEVLLSLCMAGDPSACRAERRPGGASYAECRLEADRLSAAHGDWIAQDLIAQDWIAQDWPCAPAGETPAFPVTEVAPGVWVHKAHQAEVNPQNGGDIANLGFIIGRDAVAVIDAGSTAAIARALLAEIRARTELPVRWAIITHMHPDHALGASVFQEAGATLIGHGKLERGLAARAETYETALARLIGPAFEGTHVALPDEGVAATREIDLGGRVLLLEAHPVAHTDNDLSVFDAATGSWFLGDLLFMGHVPALDGSLRGWIGLTQTLAGRRVARVIPGHGPVAAPWPEAAAPMRFYLDAIEAETRAAIAAGRPMLGAVAEIGESQRRRWLLFDAFNQRTATAAFQELEWE